MAAMAAAAIEIALSTYGKRIKVLMPLSTSPSMHLIRGRRPVISRVLMAQRAVQLVLKISQPIQQLQPRSDNDNNKRREHLFSKLNETMKTG